MLFKNLKTGNLVAPKDAESAEMMARSPIYEEVKAKAPEKKPAKTAKAKQGA